MTPLFHAAEDVAHGRLDLYNLVAVHPHATFFMRYTGPDVPELLLQRNDVLVIDRSVTPVRGSLVVAHVDGELVVQVCTQQEDIEIWGVVCHVVHSLRHL